MKQVRKIAFFVPTLNIGGTEHSFVKLANAFIKKGERVQFVVSRKEGVLLKELFTEVQLIDLGNLRFSTSFFALKAYLERERPTHLITGSNMHNEFVVLVNRFSRYKTKVILTQRNFLDAEIQDIPIYGKLCKPLMKYLYPKADKVVAVSKGIKSFLNDFMPSLSVLQIYNPFDIREIMKKSCETLDLVLPPKYILFVGRFVEVKNLNLLLNSLALLVNEQPDIKLVMLGSGVILEQLRKEVKELSLEDRVVFIASLSNPYSVIKNADVLVLPSLSESLGGVLIEALALGTTVVATPTRGAKEVLNDGDFGYIASSFADKVAFSDLIFRALNKPLNPEKLRNRALCFDSDYVSDEYLKILD